MFQLVVGKYVLLYLLLIINSLILIREIRKVTFLLKKGTQTMGHIISKEEVPDYEAGLNPIKLKIRFQDIKGQEYIFKETIPFNEININDPIKIIYDSKKPKRAMIHSNDISPFRNIVFWLLTGSILIIASLSTLF